MWELQWTVGVDWLGPLHCCQVSSVQPRLTWAQSLLKGKPFVITTATRKRKNRKHSFDSDSSLQQRSFVTWVIGINYWINMSYGASAPPAYVSSKFQINDKIYNVPSQEPPEDGEYGGLTNSFTEKSVRLGFIRKVYSILSVQVI